MEWNILKKRLTGKGIAGSNIPAYLRDVKNNLDFEEEIDLQDLNNRLKRLGWDEFELDDHTLQIIIAAVESQEQEVKENRKYYPYDRKQNFAERTGSQFP